VRKHARLIRRGGSTDKERRGPPSRGEGRHREERRGEDAEHARPTPFSYLFESPISQIEISCLLDL